MGENAPESPSPAGSITRVGTPGNTRDTAKTYTEDNNNVTEYYYTPEEQQLQDYRVKGLLQNTPNVNVMSPEYQAERNRINQANTEMATKNINAMYNPMVQNEMADVYNKQGTLKSSRFINGLNDIEKSRASAINDFQNEQIANQQNYNNNALNQQYAYLNFLANGNNQYLQNANTGGQIANNNANALNNFNQGNYAQQSQNYNQYQSRILAYLTSPQNAKSQI